jgi:ubiquinone/menaquinone biosynthesis C-methylase UbiE
MKDPKSTTRFSSRVNDYIKYRPHYPGEVVSFLQENYGLGPHNTIADIGAGTGISSRLFLEKGYTVIAVEPNAEMRNAAVADLQHFQTFSTLAGTAEHTLLPDASIDIVVAAQAFHWFDTLAVKEEFRRILKPNGLVVLMWNERLIRTDFEQEYDQLILKYATDYVQHDHRNIDHESLNRFFAPNRCDLNVFPNYQVFDFEGLKGRLVSSSYMPQTGDNSYDEMVADLQNLFDRYQEDNAIRITYDTKLYIGVLDK